MLAAAPILCVKPFIDFLKIRLDVWIVGGKYDLCFSFNFHENTNFIMIILWPSGSPEENKRSTINSLEQPALIMRLVLPEFLSANILLIFDGVIDLTPSPSTRMQPIYHWPQSNRKWQARPDLLRQSSIHVSHELFIIVFWIDLRSWNCIKTCFVQESASAIRPSSGVSCSRSRSVHRWHSQISQCAEILYKTKGSYGFTRCSRRDSFASNFTLARKIRLND